MAQVETLIAQVKTQGVEKSAQDLDKLAASADKAGDEIGQAGQQAKKAGPMFKQFRGASSALTNTTGQLSVQVQDVAVQLESGTDAIRVFAQQGPQIAAIFGPSGALFGAIIAVGALIAGPFVRSLFAANEAIEETSKRLKEVTDGINELTEKEKNARLSILTTEMRQQQETISALKDQLEEAKEEFNLFNSRQTTTGTVIAQVTGGFLTYSEALNESAGAVNIANAALEKAEAKLNEQLRLAGLLTGKTKELTKEEKKNAEAVEAALQSGREQVQVLGMSATEAELFRLEMKGATEQQIEARRVQLEATEAFKADQEAREEAKKLADQEKRSRESFIAGIVEQTIAFGNSRAELLRHRAAQHDLTVEQQAQVEVLAQLIEKKEADAEATKKQTKEQRELAKAVADERARRSAEDQRIYDRVQEMEAAERELKKAGLIEAEKDEYDSYQRRKAMLEKHIAEKNISEKTYQEAKRNLEKQAEESAINSLGEGINALGQYNQSAFKMAKGFNLAQAVMNTATGATKALSAYPPPYNYVAAAGVVAQGLAQVAAIRSQTFQGRALGGQVRAGESYIVGERGPEVLTMGAANGRVMTNEALQNQPKQQVSRNIVINLNVSGVRDEGTLQRSSSRIAADVSRAVNRSRRNM